MSNKDRVAFKVIYVLIFICIIGCNTSNNNQNDKKQLIYNISVGVIGKENYNQLRLSIQDSITSWKINELSFWSVPDSICSYRIDSVLCINTSKTRLISAVLSQYKTLDNLCGGLLFFYGEKINDRWYFWTGASVFIPQEMNKNLNVKKPISFSQLHEQALKEVFGGYLTKDGQINEEWFEFHFEKNGWVQFEDQGERFDYFLKGKRYTDKKEFLKTMHLYKSKKIWIDKAIKDSLERTKS